MRTPVGRKALFRMSSFAFGLIVSIWARPPAFAQVNSGSDGHDGALHVTNTITIDMADHPDGIYHYTSVKIEGFVSFIPNANNSPVTWLVQSNCVIGGTILLQGQNGAPGPGGFYGGMGGPNATAGRGPGGGPLGTGNRGGPASYGGLGGMIGTTTVGAIYGNKFLLPLLGGSGGGGATVVAAGDNGAGGSGGGAILIAAGNEIVLDGTIQANSEPVPGRAGGQGSGGAVRLLAKRISGFGLISAVGLGDPAGGQGRVRLDAQIPAFRGSIFAEWSEGYQPIILPGRTDNLRLEIVSVGGVEGPAKPLGLLTRPDVVIPATVRNPVPIIVRCSNVPLNTAITVEVFPVTGPAIRAAAMNSQGTLASSTATAEVNLPKGGGAIQATLITAIAGQNGALLEGKTKAHALAATGWTADGERLAGLQVTTVLGGNQQFAYIAESGKKYPLPAK